MNKNTTENNIEQQKTQKKYEEPDSGFLSTLIFMIVATLIMIAISYFIG